MTIDSSSYQLESSETEEPTEKLVAIRKGPGLRTHQRTSRQHDPQTIFADSYDLSVIVPTRNELDNIWPLLESLQSALRGLRVEVIFVDDSDDDTAKIISDMARTLNSPLFHIQLEHRTAGEARAGGLATAVVHGMNKARAMYIAVIDADLQHPPQQLRLFYEQAVAQNADLVVASRYIKGGSNRGLDGIGRRCISVGLKWTAKLLFPGQLFRLSDPLSGFFLLRRSLLDGISLRPIGYKILLEISLRCPWQNALEVPYHFQARTHGQSKVRLQQGLLVLRHMLRLWREVPAAGRIWKITLLLLLNILVMVGAFELSQLISGTGTNLNPIIYTVMACLDFILFNRFIFPSSRVAGNSASPTLEDTQKIEIEAIDTLTLPPAEQVVISASDLIRRLQQGRKKRLYEKLPFLLAAAVVALAVVWISFTRPGPILVLAVLFFGFAITLTNNNNREQATTMVLAIAVGVATVDYLSWRFVSTNWSGWWVALPLLFAETLGGLHILGFQFTVWPWSPPEIVGEEDPTLYPIYVFIPTLNEGVAILRPTLEGIIAARDKYLARYPHGRVTIVVCNDGYVANVANWEEVDRLAKSLGVCCITRTQGGGAKAGNIENARRELRAEGDVLLVIFDADQVAKPDFLLKTIPPFRDPQMGWVQTGQYYGNLDNPVSRWADDQQSMFYNLLCPGKAALNAAFICGTNVVIRAAALDQIGGLPQDSVTEDFAASIALHPNWHSVYLTDVLATGLGPLDVPSYLKQQRRWAIGTMSVFRNHWREILLPRKHGLQFGQRVQYFLACTHYLCGLRDLIYLLSPMLFIFTGIPAVRSPYLSDYLLHFLPYCLLSIVALWYAARGITGLRGIIIGFGSFPVLIGSLLSVILQRKVGFAVTSKRHKGKRSLGYLWVYAFLMLVCFACLVWATRLKGKEQTSVFISILWVVYSLAMLGSFLWLNLKDIRFHKTMQQSGSTDEMIAKQPYPSKLARRVRGLQPVWNLGLAVLLAGPILASNTLGSLALFAGSGSTPFIIGQDRIVRPYFGVSLPVQLLNSQPPVLEHELNTQFTIIGRTQDIHDLFDTSWANQLAAQNARPWITLQFGVFGPDGKPPLSGSLLSVINGLHDQEIKRWADAIHKYGRPVYLTVFLHADKNWSLSSGVTNGGIPEDVSKAWMHVQSIFRAEGANNAAWVWAPADPLHDQQYAPPPSTIDAVLQSFINYPNTQWGDPETELHKLINRYPGKPLFVEASAAGPATEKAAWLIKLGQAIEAVPQVYALLYHEGGPDLKPNSTEVKSWSLASDPDSLAAMQTLADDLHNINRSGANINYG